MQEDGFAMTMPKEERPAEVPATATPAGTVRDRWSWTEPAAWTERMLTALETGVKGNVWFSLIDKVFAERNLRGLHESAVQPRLRRGRSCVGR